MASTYKQPGNTIAFIAPAGGVTSGTPVIIGGYFVIPTTTAAVDVAFDGMIVGVHELGKTDSQAWEIGDEIYWDVANSKADNSSAAKGPLIGVAASKVAVTAGLVKGEVRLNGVALSVSGVQLDTPADASVATAGNATITIAQLLTGGYNRDCAGGARTDTLPTAALLVAGIPNCKVGHKFACLIVNGSDAAETLTIAAGAGGAFDANLLNAKTVAQNDQKTLRIRVTNVGAGTEAYIASL